ncbi:MAG: hypothetical protein LYZ69_09655 [Nitrososphaerales archaeon]|nr:hypothetical protein [Nitrososphaerales archaeon]
MKAKIILDGEKPKVSYAEARKALRTAGVSVTAKRPDIGVVVGGDGVFSRVGRLESIPLLFVGIRSTSATDSKAYLAAAYFDELPSVLREISAGRFRVEEYRRLEVLKNGKSLGTVFTDVYLQRGADSNCIRYKVKVSGKGIEIDEAAIGDGVVVSTAAGSTGYFSYPDRVRGGDLDPAGHTALGRDQVGICHILPTYTERRATGGHPLRYTVPWGCRVELSVTRPADARLYGVGRGRGGIRVSTRDVITVSASPETTKLVVL